MKLDTTSHCKTDFLLEFSFFNQAWLYLYLKYSDFLSSKNYYIVSITWEKHAHSCSVYWNVQTSYLLVLFTDNHVHVWLSGRGWWYFQPVKNNLSLAHHYQCSQAFKFEESNFFYFLQSKSMRWNETLADLSFGNGNSWHSCS